MAEVISIQGTTATAKIRNPFVAFLLVFVTLGIYYLVWYYKINRELRDLGRAAGQEERLGRSPFTSLMAITFGWLILVPPFVSTYRALKRIQAAQEISGTTGEPINVWLGFLLYVVGVFTFPVEILYAQSELNRLWRTTPVAPGGRARRLTKPPRRRPVRHRRPIISHRTHPRREPHEHPSTAQQAHEPRPSLLSRTHCSARRRRRSRSLLRGPRGRGSARASASPNGVRGSGVPATQARTVPSFGAIDLTGSSSVTVHVGPRQTVVVHADDNLIDRVTTDVRDGVLVVSGEPHPQRSIPGNRQIVSGGHPTTVTQVMDGSGAIAARTPGSLTSPWRAAIVRRRPPSSSDHATGAAWSRHGLAADELFERFNGLAWVGHGVDLVLDAVSRGSECASCRSMRTASRAESAVRRSGMSWTAAPAATTRSAL